MQPMNEIIRQTEILASVLNNQGKGIPDFAREYNVSVITINRDLNRLRKLGIEIFSRKGRLVVLNNIPKSVLNLLLSEYLPLKLKSDIYLQKLAVYSENVDVSYFKIISIITKAIKENRIIKIEYQRIRDNEINNYLIQPLKIINSEFNWILQGIKTGETILKTFYLSRILRIELTGETFSLQQPIETTQKPEKIVLRFSPLVTNEISDKIWFDDFTITKGEDGHLYLETHQPVSLRLASWCVSWCDKLKIIEPESLKKLIRDMVESFRENNEI